jgi:phage-related protein
MGDFLGISAPDEISWVAALTNAAVAALYGIIAGVTGAVNDNTDIIWGALSAFPVGLGEIWATIQKAWHDFWAGNFRAFLADLLALIREIEQDLKYVLQPLINWIKFEKAWLDQVWNNVIKPIMNLLQRIRSILVIFRLLHIGWATSLDQWLAQLEGRISTAFLQARQDITTLGNWINYIIDPTGLFNVPLMLLTQLQTLPQLWAALAGIPGAAVGAATAQAQATMAASGTKANATADIQSRTAGPTADDLANHSTILALYQADGYTGF